MKISLNWVKKYTDIKYKSEKLKERVSVSLTEVEDIEDFGEKYKGIITAKVTKVEKHPKTSRLLVLTLDIGKEDEVNSVVQKCKVKAGDITVFIKPMLKIPTSGDKVQKAEIRGVKSDGFVPSGRELGLNYDHTNVFTLPDDTKVGVELTKILNIDDQILEIKNKTLTHRPDCFGLYGVSREIAAIQGTGLKRINWLDNPETIKPENGKNEVKITIDNKDPKLCKRYMAVVIKGVEVKPSPIWLQVELSKMGIHPVNNIVDITNYLMILTGQPSHAFDYDKVVKGDSKSDEPVLTIRTAKKGEHVVTIDGKKREMDKDMLVIADSSKAIAVAGVMGGKETEIGNDTKNVIYQVENLDMYSIRRSSMKLGLFTDAVTRFSKGIDPNLCEPVMYKALEMMLELAGGGMVSNIEDNYPSKVKSWTIEVDPEEIREKMGISIKDEDIKDILKRLEIGAKKGKKWTLTIPTFRNDLKIPEDINEEVARIYGYDKVTPKLPTREIKPVSDDAYRENIVRIKHILKGLGANEIYSYSFISKSLYSDCGLAVEDCYKLVNAISPELVYMRPLIFPSLLEKIPHNFKENGDYASFEIDLIDPCGNTKKLPIEKWHLGITHTVSYYHLKLYLDHMLEGLAISDYRFIPLGDASKSKMADWINYARGSFHPLRTALVEIGGKILGVIGEVDVLTREKIDLPKGTSACELNLDNLCCYVKDTPDYRPVSRYPSVVRDYSFIVGEKVQYREILDAILDLDIRIIRKIECLDIYQKKGSDKKKTTFRINYLSDKKTLEESDLNEVEEKILKSVRKAVDGKLAK